MTAKTPDLKKKMSPATTAKLEEWSERFQARLGEMLESFTVDDMKLSRAAFGENFTEQRAALDLLSFGIFASLSSGSSVEEITTLAQHIHEEREKRPTRSLIEEDDASEFGGG